MSTVLSLLKWASFPDSKSRRSRKSAAVSLRVIVKAQLPDASTMTIMNIVVSIPAGFDSGSYSLGAFALSGAPKGSYKWIAEIRNPTTNALIDSDTWTWTLS